jgi:YHS domain-containing protein
MTKDPVCGMQVDENKAAATSSYQGKKYSFCGQECKNKFDSEPQRYAQQQDTQKQGKQQQGKQQPHQPEHANR